MTGRLERFFFSRRNIDWIQLNVRVRRRRFVEFLIDGWTFTGSKKSIRVISALVFHMFLYDFNVKIVFESVEFGVNVT